MKVRENVLIEPPKFEYEPYVSIPFEEYKELLIYKGKCLALLEVRNEKFIIKDSK